MNILLSPKDIQYALFGSTIVERQHPGFTNYIELLRLRVEGMVPLSTDLNQHIKDLQNNVPSISIPYTKSMVEMFAYAIQEGTSLAEKDAEKDSMLLDSIKDTFTEMSAINAARYASASRNNKKRKFKLIQGGKNDDKD